MANKLIKRSGLEVNVIKRLCLAKIVTCQDLLTKNCLEIQKITGTSYSQVNQIICQVSQYCIQKPQTVLELWKYRNQHGVSFLKTSLDLLDDVLHGGIPVGTVTEIAGPSGCGKTQFSIMLSVISTLPVSRGGLDGAVLYIDTESAFSAERLVEIAENKFPDVFNTEESLVKLTSRIHVFIESTCASLLHRLESLEEDIITHGVRLIVVDSVASLIRKEFDSSTSQNMIERTKLLSKQAAMLKYIAETFNIPVVVTNQITTRYSNKSSTIQPSADLPVQSTDNSLDGDGSYVTAALGNTWSHCVNTRLIVQYLDQKRRQVLVAKSPISPFANFVYSIHASGIELEKGGACHYEGTDPGLQHITVRSSLPQGDIIY